MRKKKFTDQQLSRIFSNRDLLRGAGYDFYPGVFGVFDLSRPANSTRCSQQGCINQIAYNDPRYGESRDRNVSAADWFDSQQMQTIRKMGTERLLRRLERLGVA